VSPVKYELGFYIPEVGILHINVYYQGQNVRAWLDSTGSRLGPAVASCEPHDECSGKILTVCLHSGLGRGVVSARCACPLRNVSSHEETFLSGGNTLLIPRSWQTTESRIWTCDQPRKQLPRPSATNPR
jgi:hypothetical protein